MIEFLEYIAHFFISPINTSLLLGVISLLLYLYNKVKASVFSALLSLLWLLLCSQLVFVSWIGKPLERAFAPIQATSNEWQETDAIWVLACLYYDKEHMPEVSQWNQCSLERLIQAAIMYQQQSKPIYLTGGDFNEFSDALYSDRAKQFLMQLGVNEADIISIPEGSNTKEELDSLAAYKGNKALSVISSATHGIRLSKLLQKQGTAFTFVPVHYCLTAEHFRGVNLPSLRALSCSQRYFYEYFALAKLALFDE